MPFGPTDNCPNFEYGNGPVVAFSNDAPPFVDRVKLALGTVLICTFKFWFLFPRPGPFVLSIAIHSLSPPKEKTGGRQLAPPLVDSEWVSGSPERLARIVLQGLRGPIRVKKQQDELDMPSLGVLNDEQIAGAITYVRRSWGHGFSPVDTAFVRRVREATKSRDDAWTEAELLKLK